MFGQKAGIPPATYASRRGGVSCRENDESLEGSNQEAVKKQSKSSQKVPAALCPGVFYCRLPDVLDSDEYIPAGYN